MNDEADGTLTALIADDEPLLRASLRSELQKAWPDLNIVAEVANGEQAIRRLRERGVTVAFLDIQMPGMTGLEVARRLVQDWPPFATDNVTSWPPLLVFVTAFNEFALEAFEGAAVDYVLKPVTPDRLSLTVSRLQARLHERAAMPAGIDKSALKALALHLTQLAGEQSVQTPALLSPHLKFIRASIGDTVRMIPVERVLLFEAADKYVIVHSVDGESLIRESLRELSKQLDPAHFQQVHRSAIVNMQAVKTALHDERGKLVLKLDGIKKQPVVSRHYAHLFKAM